MRKLSPSIKCGLMCIELLVTDMVVCNAVKYEARLEGEAVVAKSDGVEFTVQEGVLVKY